MTAQTSVQPSVRLGEHPVIAGFHPDPTVCRVGRDYYLATSSFEYAPAVPVFHSRDLVNWQQVGNALATPEHFPAGDVPASQGIYAPTLRHYDGRFWLITTNVSRTPSAQLLVTAADPAGPWSSPTYIEGLRGIDPDLAWDDDGSCFVTYCSNEPGREGIAQARIDPVAGVRLEEPRLIWRGTGLAYPEAPHLYRVGSWWYLMIAEGGTERGHGVSIARSRTLTGPFTAAPANPVFSHRSTTQPVQNTGHADLVQRHEGDWAAVYLGVRPRGTTPLFHVNGRETFLAGIDWTTDGWPAFDPHRFTARLPDRSFTDRFDDELLHPRWISPGAAPADFTTPHPDGGVQLRRVASPNGSPAMLGVRAGDQHWTAEAEVTPGPGSSAALLLRLDDRHWCAVRAEDGTARGVLRIGPVECEIGSLVAGVAPGAALRLSSVPATHDGPDDIELAAVTDGVVHLIARFDGRYLSTEVAGGFTGRVIGVTAEHGTARLTSFRYTAGHNQAETITAAPVSEPASGHYDAQPADS
ncbi:family 43 glycosylhydrolase [Streptomyces sp. CA-111067]|uniref:glycoside hydrolase family 43 protein n=1 Tax=Streptomyces sp. CA-111067 TaxID=3240046 RepID=UPI003D952505